MSNETLGEIIIETTRIGSAVRITAVHVKTGTEVVFQVPAYSTQPAIQRLAAQKLKYVLEKKK